MQGAGKIRVNFQNWEKPVFDKNGLTKWHWVCQYNENLILGEYTDVGAFTYINASFGVIIEDHAQIGSHCSIYSQSTIGNIVTPFFYQMVVVGEKTGTVGESLTNIVDFYQTEINRNLDDFIKLLEPIFIVVLGLVVAGLVGAVLLPLYSVGLE